MDAFRLRWKSYNANDKMFQRNKNYEHTYSDHNGFLINVSICDPYRNSVPFVQFKKCEKHPRRSDTYSKVAG